MSISSLGGASYVSPLSAIPQSAASGAASSSGSGAAAENFLMNYSNMTPAQQMQASVMSSMGITNADLNNMSPQERNKIEQEIQEKVKQAVQNQVEKKSGLVVDIKA